MTLRQRRQNSKFFRMFSAHWKIDIERLVRFIIFNIRQLFSTRGALYSRKLDWFIDTSFMTKNETARFPSTEIINFPSVARSLFHACPQYLRTVDVSEKSRFSVFLFPVVFTSSYFLRKRQLKSSPSEGINLVTLNMEDTLHTLSVGHFQETSLRHKFRWRKKHFFN